MLSFKGCHFEKEFRKRKRPVGLNNPNFATESILDPPLLRGLISKNSVVYIM